MIVKPSSVLSEATKKRLEGHFLSEYSGKRDSQKINNVQFKFGPDGATASTPTSLIRHRYWQADNSSMVQFSEIMCALNIFPEYEAFETYAPQLKNLLSKYISETSPSSIQWL